MKFKMPRPSSKNLMKLQEKKKTTGWNNRKCIGRCWTTRLTTTKNFQGTVT